MKGPSEGHFSSSAAGKASSMPHAVGRVRLDPAMRSERLAEREAQEAPDGGYDDVLVQVLSCKGGAPEKGTARRQMDGTYQITYASGRAEAGLSFRTIKGRAVQPASLDSGVPADGRFRADAFEGGLPAGPTKLRSGVPARPVAAAADQGPRQLATRSVPLERATTSAQIRSSR